MSTQPADDTRDASLRVAKRYRDALKAYAAINGRPLYDVTNEAIELYLDNRKFSGMIKTAKSSPRAGAAGKKRAAKRSA